MAVYTLEIPGWHPTPLNKLLNSHWAKAGRMKEADREMVGKACLVYGVQPAICKRRVRLLLVLGKGARACDPDAYQKSLFDALVHAKALRNDNRQWCELTTPRFARGDVAGTFITLEDV